MQLLLQSPIRCYVWAFVWQTVSAWKGSTGKVGRVARTQYSPITARRATARLEGYRMLKRAGLLTLPTLARRDAPCPK